MEYSKGDLILIHTKTENEKEYISRVGRITSIDGDNIYGTWGNYIANPNKDTIMILIKRL